MAIRFSADEIFEMAEEIEKNAVRFYRKAAENASDAKIKQMLLDMATTEDDHLEIFQEMRDQLTEIEKAGPIYDPDDIAARYLQMMADTHSYEGKKNPEEELTGSESIAEILQAAIEAEKDSVVFYSALKNFVSQRLGKDKIEKIILEEVGHVADLNLQLRESK